MSHPFLQHINVRYMSCFQSIGLYIPSFFSSLRIFSHSFLSVGLSFYPFSESMKYFLLQVYRFFRVL